MTPALALSLIEALISDMPEIVTIVKDIIAALEGKAAPTYPASVDKDTAVLDGLLQPKT